jgi:putative ABC transport system permease protein
MRIYRWLLKLYPARFREEYETPLERQFLDDYREARSARALLVFWLRALWDLCLTIPSEFARELWQDLRFAPRVHRQRPLTAVLALVALALAIGTTTGIFSVVNALLIRELPFRDPERLVHITMFSNLVAGRAGVKDWAAHSSYLDGAAEFYSVEMTLSHEAGAVRVKVAETSSNFFQILGIDPEFGRNFRPEEDMAGWDAVAVIGNRLWRQLFAGDPRVLGSTIRLNGVPLTVIGVAPAGLDYPATTSVWTPARNFPMPAGVVSGQILGRLKPGMGVVPAREMFLAEVRQVYPESVREVGMGFSQMTSLRDELAGTARQASMVLFGAVVFVLLIACANVAQLLLARTAGRHGELALRAALGASRSRLVQQLITEALLLTLAAAAAGLAVAYWTSRLATAMQPAPLATQAYTILDGRVLGFAVMLAILTGIVFGVTPAVAIARGSTRSAAGRMRIGLVALQAALTVILLTGSITMDRAFFKLLGTDLGFRTNHVVTMNVSLAGTSYQSKNAEPRYYDAALSRLRAIPGVDAAGAVNYLPLIESGYRFLGGDYKLDAGARVEGNIVVSAVTTGYFQAIGTQIAAGREFTDAERQGPELVAIVNEEFARGVAVLGRKAKSSFGNTFTIVGVVATSRLGGPASPAIPQVFVPVEQYSPGFMTLIARVHGNAANYLAVCRDAVQQVDREIPVYDVKTLDQRLADTLARPRLYTTAVLFLGGFALLLAVIGIYGVASYSITQRAHEIGVRIAVGATPARLRVTLVRQSMLPVLAGMSAGVAGAAGLGKFLQHLVSSAEPPGIRTCLAAAVVLAATAIVAVWTATSRVVQVDPMTQLKSE